MLIKCSLINGLSTGSRSKYALHILSEMRTRVEDSHMFALLMNPDEVIDLKHISKLGNNSSNLDSCRSWHPRVNSLRPSEAYLRHKNCHYVNQWWNIVNWSLRNKLQWNIHLNSFFVIQENAFGSAVCEMSTIFALASKCLHIVADTLIKKYDKCAVTFRRWHQCASVTPRHIIKPVTQFLNWNNVSHISLETIVL